MQLVAVSRADGVDPKNLDGFVTAAFERACAIEGRDGRLVTLAAETFGNMPGAILVALPAGFRFVDRAARGTPVHLRGGVLRFAAHDLSVDLRPARIWTSGIAGLGLDMTGDAVERAWRAAAAMLARDGRAAPLASSAERAIAALGEAAGRMDVRSAGEHATRLLGLGEGATPAGDDFLVGFLGGRWASAGRNRARGEFVAALGAVIVVRTGATTRASRVYLEAAATGQISQRLTDLAGAIAAGDGQATIAAMRAALAIGHSSGACGVLGLLHGTAATMADSGSATTISI